MPYKARLREGQERKREKPTYWVTNCHEYNQLKKRGKISLYFPDGDLKSQFINASPYVCGVSGRSSSYRVPYIEDVARGWAVEIDLQHCAPRKPRIRSIGRPVALGKTAACRRGRNAVPSMRP